MEVKFINFKGERCKCDLRGYLLGGVIELFIFNPDTREYGRKIAATRGLDKFLYDNMYSQPWDVSNSHPCYSLMVFITDIHR